MTRTLFLARLLGLFLIIVSLAILLHREAMIATIDELLLDSP